MSEQQQLRLPATLSEQSDGGYSSELEQASSHTDLEVVSAGFFLFEFARHNRQSRITKRINTLSPNKELSVITIDVETHESEESQNNKAPKGLPGPLAQDVYMALMGMHVESLGKTFPALGQTSTQKAVATVPKDANKVYFKIKNLAERLGINPKNSRIGDALDHLRRTRIKISGTIYRNDGQEVKVSLDTNYITALSVYRSIKDRQDETQWHSAEFSTDIVKNVLQGAIARVDNEKMKQLPSGPTRRLYQMLSAKRYYFRSNQIPVSTEEIRELLCIAEATFNKSAKKYFGDLVDAKIIERYTVERIGGTSYYVFEMSDDDVALLPSSSDASRWYFSKLHEIAQVNPKIKKLLIDGSKCDLTEGKLSQLLKQFPEIVQHNKRDYFKAVLWADMLIQSQVNSGNMNSIFATLRSRLDKNQEPELRGFVYRSFLDELTDGEARKRAQEKALSDRWRAEQMVQVIENKVSETMDRLEADGKMTKFIADIRKHIFAQNNSVGAIFMNDPRRSKMMASNVVRHGIKAGIPTKDLYEMILEYKKSGDQGFTEESGQQILSV